MHGRGRKADSLEDTYFGVHQEQLYARKLKPVEGTLMLRPFLCLMTKFCVCLGTLKLGHFLESYVTFFVPPCFAGAQWTGIVTTIAIEMLKSNMVEAVVCVQR